MAQGTELGTYDRRSSSSSVDRGATGPSLRAAPLLSPPPPRDDRTLEAHGSAPRPTAGNSDTLLVSTPVAGPTTPPTSPERLAMLAAQLPSVAREAYTFGQEVAKGGIGRVLRARDQRLDRPVAIKELLVWNERQEQRFVREALLTARLQHPAIVPIYEAGRWPDGEPFYAMKLVSGRSLADMISERASLGERLSLLPHVLAVAQAIAYAHSKRIIHRDLKPANVLVGEFGETVVIDWGLAKDLAEEDATAPEGPPVTAGEGLTLQGSIVGTPSYMPPEQAAGSAVDERADVYAIGAMLYHLLAAVAPYHDVPWEKLLATIAEKPPRRIEKLAPQISDELAAIVNKAMARDPAKRYRTAKELADDLHRFQTGQIVAAHTYSTGEMLRRYWRRNRSALSVAATAIALVTLVVIGAFVKTDRERRFALIKEKEAVEASREAEAARQAAEAAGEQATARADEMTLLQAQGALQRDPNEALAWLKMLSPDFADADEVRRIAADAQARGIARVYRGHRGHINHAVVSKDGKRFATASDDKTVRVWDIETAQSRVLTGHTDEVWNLVFLDGEDRLATVSKDATMRIWDLGTGAQVGTIALASPSRQLIARADGSVVGTPKSAGVPWIWRPGASSVEPLSEPGEDPVSSVFSLDATRLIVQLRDGDAYVRDVATGEKHTIVRETRAPGAWSPNEDGRIAVRGEKTDKESVEIWDLSTMTSRRLDSPPRGGWPLISPRGDRFAIATREGVHVYDTRTGTLLRRLAGHEGPTMSMAFSRDGQRLATGGFDLTVRVWDLTTGESQVHAGFQGAPYFLDFLLDDRTVLATSTTGEARLFEPRRAGKILTDHGAPVTGLAFSADGRAASIDQKGTLRITDLEGARIAEHTVPPSPVAHLFTSPDRRSFAGVPLAWKTGDNDCTPATKAPPGVLVLGTFDDREPKQVDMPAAIHALAWLPGGDAVVVALSDGSVRRVDREGSIVEIDRFVSAATALALSADGEWVAAGGEDGTVRLTEIATGQHRELGHHGDLVMSLAFSPDGEWLASGCHDHTARVWRVDDGTFRSFDEGGHGVRQVAFSKDSRALFLLSHGEMHVRRLVVETGEHLSPFTGHRGVILGFTLSEDGHRLLTYGTDGSARIVDATTGRGRTLAGHARESCQAAFAADGRSVMTIGLEGTVRAWPDDLPETMPDLRAWIDAATPDRIEDG